MPSLEPVEGNPFEPKLEPVEGIPFETPPLTGAEGGPPPIPQPFVDRLSKGMAVSRIMQKASESFKDGLGSEPVTGVSDETRQQMIDIGLIHDPAKPGPVNLFD